MLSVFIKFFICKGFVVCLFFLCHERGSVVLLFCSKKYVIHVSINHCEQFAVTSEVGMSGMLVILYGPT